VWEMVVPTPIGVGPEYHPRPAVHGPCAAAPASPGRRVHLELFAGGRVVIVPARIGVRPRCHTRIWTTEPTGVIRFAGRSTLGDLFAVWGQALGPRRLLSFRGPVRIYRKGARLLGDPRRLLLRDRDELVLEVGPFVPPHRSYLFPPH
jgi:hypothetical protein